MKPYYDHLIKNLSYNKNLAKASGFEGKTIDTQPILDETKGGVDYDSSKTAEQNVVRYGRCTILPSFFNLLSYLGKKVNATIEDFSVVLHDFNHKNLEHTVEEVNLYCDGRHPCYNGANKTKKIFFNGDKNTKDMRIDTEK